MLYTFYLNHTGAFLGLVSNTSYCGSLRMPLQPSRATPTNIQVLAPIMSAHALTAIENQDSGKPNEAKEQYDQNDACNYPWLCRALE